MRRGPRALLLALAVAAAVSGCGKRGAPLAPIRVLPGPITNLTARRSGDEVKVSFNVPAVNSDSSTPPVVAAIDVYAVAGPPTVVAATPIALANVPLSVPTNYVPPPVVPPPPNRPPPPPPITTLSIARFPPSVLFEPLGARRALSPTRRLPPATIPEIMVHRYRQKRIEVRPLPTSAIEAEPTASEPAPAPASAPAATDPRPAPGETMSLTIPVAAERASAEATPDASVFRIVIVGTTKNQRRGAPSALLEFPLTTEVLSPKEPKIAYDVATMTLTWTPGAPAQSYRVYKTDRDGKEEDKPLNAAPLAVTTFGVPVEFGVERCFAVRAVVVRNPASTESAPTPPICVTAADTFPPVAPTGLSLLPTDTQVQLQWNAVTAADLAGYLVLRGVDGAAPAPITSEPITATTYRDATIRAGARYAYVVVAVDKAGNRSQPSNQVEEAR